MRIQTVLTGTSGYMQHNIQLADPLNEWTRRIAAITGKRNMTEEDHIEKSRLEWFGSLYLADGQIVVPTANVKRCFQEAAKVGREGRAIVRALLPVTINTPLLFNNPHEGDDEFLDKLWKDQNFRDSTLVGIGKRRVPRTRPFFLPWALAPEWELNTKVLDLDRFKEVVQEAGVIEGLGDNRVNGYGRFTAVVR